MEANDKTRCKPGSICEFCGSDRSSGTWEDGLGLRPICHTCYTRLAKQSKTVAAKRYRGYTK